MGALLRSVEQWWEERDYHPGHDECLRYLRELIAGEGCGC
jgi:hypothetical protein